MDPVELIKLEISFDIRLGHTVMSSKINTHFFPLDFGEGENILFK